MNDVMGSLSDWQKANEVSGQSLVGVSQRPSNTTAT